jgi:two-component system response regulator YesN
MLDELKAQESILNGMNVTIGMGSMVNTAGSIRKSFLDAVFMIKQRLLLGTGRMLEMDEAQQRKNSDFINSEAFYRFNREMERAVEALNVVETRRTIEGLRDVLKNYPGITGYEILQMTKEACNHYLFCMKSRGSVWTVKLNLWKNSVKTQGNVQI